MVVAEKGPNAILNRRIIKLRAGDIIPDGAHHLKTVREPDHENAQLVTRPAEGLAGLFMRIERVHTPIATFHYYEVTEGIPDEHH